ncbi:DUF3857 domain-containing transglutaminase family protein [Hwangdonia lutea]|uniref:DUF3857 domain-containing transglutaminase family protein n=1 Tax=Hwangdonia lutea TaxID=3075823 RepID=A0AA97ENM1_9FLAO|nr:DUF3857 domain-containing transglutaminase family protein [Hwangdonia sp. SCSIO 19198]WOD44467.1 DUF3857 domain-containing transglutaminase family protein [Hwangdonia sp. SCSIO 19198]
MSLKTIANTMMLFATLTVFSQDHLYSSLTIPEDLIQNANAVVRLNEVVVSLKSSSEMSVKEKRIITVLNKKGNRNVDAYVYYDDKVKIKTLEVLVFDAFGNEIKKIRKNDFKDVSAVDGGTLYSDSRVKYLEYTPIKYPYTIEFTSETITSNTAFIPSFTPINSYLVSAETSTYTINYPEHITIRKKEKNFENIEIESETLTGKIFYKAKNLKAFKPEDYSPSITDFTPKVLFASKQFTLEGVESLVENWNDFAKWMYHDLIKVTHDLPESTISDIQNLVKDETNDIDKAKKIYQYVQDKVRYISVQVGIGGWKPFNASEVDRLSYGDCKGLTNYTMALLKAANIESNYSVVYAGKTPRSIEDDFTSIQGNHVILNIPQEHEDDIWLECTSQKLPFGFIGDFTDNRDVLVITPEGGKIQRTKKYHTEENIQIITGHYSVSNDGSISVNATVKSEGIQYDDKYWMESETERDLDGHYKERWSYINNMTIDNMSINNDKDSIVFSETLAFQATNYPKIVANRMLLTVNALNRNTHIPDRYRNRKLPLKIKRGFKDVDEVEILLPQDYRVESLPEKKIIENKFGSYKAEVVVKDENTLLYKREFVVNDGEFPKEDYSKFRAFYKNVSKQDNAKVALIKKEL